MGNSISISCELGSRYLYIFSILKINEDLELVLG